MFVACRLGQSLPLSPLPWTPVAEVVDQVSLMDGVRSKHAPGVFTFQGGLRG
jgi:hypothetical protein